MFTPWDYSGIKTLSSVQDAKQAQLTVGQIVQPLQSLFLLHSPVVNIPFKVGK